MTTADLEAAIIRRVYQGSYAHAENVALRLRQLEASGSHDAAVRVLHAEVMAS